MAPVRGGLGAMRRSNDVEFDGTLSNGVEFVDD
jgi:hypothetical protein